MRLLYYSVTALLLCGMCYCLTPRVGPCAAMLCPEGHVCKEQIRNCKRPPCPPPRGKCVRISKPGTCPRTTGIGICIVKCMGDSSCPGNLKCCGSCPRECKLPVRKPRVKPGKCPTTVGVGICIARCSSDTDCPGRQKCCGNCPRECKAPVTCRTNRDCRGRRRRCCNGRCLRRCRYH